MIAGEYSAHIRDTDTPDSRRKRAETPLADGTACQGAYIRYTEDPYACVHVVQNILEAVEGSSLWWASQLRDR